MNFRRIVPDLTSNKIEESKKFYSGFIGLKLAMDMDWILTFVSESNPTAQVNLLRSDKKYIDNSNVAISIESSDVDGLYKKALDKNMEIVYPLKKEEWGVKRFFVRDPNGVTVNIMCHVGLIKETKDVVKDWFGKWEKGDFLNLPVSEKFRHTSPFGTINGKEEYISMVESNKDRFLGYRFEIHDEIYEKNHACVRYTGVQGEFNLDVSEWYYVNENLIEEIVSYYHIGEIRDDRKLKK